MWKFAFVLLPLALFSTNVSAQTCDSKKLEKKFLKYKKTFLTKIEAAVLKDEKTKPDLNSYLKKLNALNACLVSEKQEPYRCENQYLRVNKPINEVLRIERTIWVVSSNQGCNYYPNEVSFIWRNSVGEQVLTYMNGMIMPNKDVECLADDGTIGGRGYVMIDNASGMNSSLFTIDFGVPLEHYHTSQFWGLSVNIGSKETLKWTYNYDDVNFTWSNGAEIHVSGKSGMVTSSNFLSPTTYLPGCITLNDGGVGFARHYWPDLQFVESGKAYLSSAPKFIKANLTDHFAGRLLQGRN
jgi:hypothetical protein